MSKSAATETMLVLRLYIAGGAPNSLSAMANASAICDTHFPAHRLEVVDMLVDPLRALADGVLVTPTLVRIAPPPIRRVIGDLSDRSNVVRILRTA